MGFHAETIVDVRGTHCGLATARQFSVNSQINRYLLKTGACCSLSRGRETRRARLTAVLPIPALGGVRRIVRQRILRQTVLLQDRRRGPKRGERCNEQRD